MPSISGSLKGVDSVGIEHYWVCSYPFFDSTVFVVPSLSTSLSPVSTQGSLEFSGETKIENCVSAVSVYDADGLVANEIEISFPQSQIGVLELESLMGSCKLEAGLKHGQVIVQSPHGYSSFCRLHTREGAALLSSPSPLTADSSTFFPLTFDEGRSYYLAIINKSRSSVSVKCRLFCAKRSPETLINLPPLGSRVLHVETEFPDYGGGDGTKQLQAYLRLSTKSEGEIGVQLVERHATKSECGIFNAVG